MQLRRFRTLVIALLAATTLWSSAAFAQTITLDMPSWQATEPGTSDWFKELIAAFEAQNPGVKIEFTHEPFAGYNDKMVTRFAAGNPPDILHLPAANFMIYAQEGWLEPLDARMTASNSAVLTEWTPVQEGCEYQGQTLCVIVLGYGYVLGWNEAAFNEVGLSGPPTNSAELIEYAKRLTLDRDGDGTIDQYGFVFPTVTHAGVETHATTFLFEADPNGHWLDAEGNLNRDAAKTAWAVLKQLVDDGSVPLGVDNNGKRQFFVEGRSAMMLEGPWIQGNINSAAPEIQAGLRVAQTPTSGEIYGGASNVLAIPAGLPAERAELAWEFIQLFTSQEWQAKYATIAGQPPARAGVLSADILAGNANMNQYVIAADSARDYIAPGTAENYTRFRDLVIEATLAVVVQGQNPDQVLDRLQSDLNRLLR
ncbi:MAG: sugar ABC transporter substrate-binding protein [Trueperaceae bacterium]|nr:sugar ABC transporter substrate-binding protein [Trueperaceae bacterium]